MKIHHIKNTFFWIVLGCLCSTTIIAQKPNFPVVGLSIGPSFTTGGNKDNFFTFLFSR